MYVNARLWIGHFDLWHEDGTIVFRHAMIFPGAEASAVAMRGAAQSGAGSLRTLLSGLPVRALGRQERRRKPSPPPCWSARGGRERLAIFWSARAGWAAPCSRAGSRAGIGPVTVVEPKPSAGTASAGEEESITLVDAPSEVAAKKILRLRGGDQAADPEKRSAGAGGLRQRRRADDLHRRGHPYQIAVQGLGRQGAHHPRHAQYAGRHRPWHHRLFAAKGATAADRKHAEALLSALGRNHLGRRRKI